MFAKHFLFLIVYVLKNIRAELSAENVVLAINCGGEEFKDSKGIVYQKVISI